MKNFLPFYCVNTGRNKRGFKNALYGAPFTHSEAPRLTAPLKELSSAEYILHIVGTTLHCAICGTFETSLSAPYAYTVKKMKIP